MQPSEGESHRAQQEESLCDEANVGEAEAASRANASSHSLNLPRYMPPHSPITIAGVSTDNCGDQRQLRASSSAQSDKGCDKWRRSAAEELLLLPDTHLPCGAQLTTRPSVPIPRLHLPARHARTPHPHRPFRKACQRAPHCSTPRNFLRPRRQEVPQCVPQHRHASREGPDPGHISEVELLL